MRIVSVGEILWDVIGEREYLGGAPLNFAAHARQLGHEVFLLSAVGEDDRGRGALESLRQRGISAEFVQVLRGKNTGIAEVELDTSGIPTFRIVRPAAYDFVDLTAAQLQRIAELRPQWIYYGTLYHMSGQALVSTLKLLEAVPSARCFYDVNLRDGHWRLAVVEQLSARANVVKLSDSEAESLDASLNAGGQGASVGTSAAAGVNNTVAKPCASPSASVAVLSSSTVSTARSLVSKCRWQTPWALVMLSRPHLSTASSKGGTRASSAGWRMRWARWSPAVRARLRTGTWKNAGRCWGGASNRTYHEIRRSL